MQDEFINRLDMFTRSLTVLELPQYKTVWENKAPLIFTTKAGEAREMVAAIQQEQKRQEARTSGTSQEKDREETELEDAAYTLAQAAVLYYNDHQQETEATELDLEPSDWRALRDQQLLAKSQLVIDRASELTSATLAAEAAKYGITPAAVQNLIKERGDYAAIVGATDVAIAIRKALTQGFRPAFRVTEAKLAELDKLILQFRSTEEGKAMVSAWQAARATKNRGRAGSPPVSPAQPTA
jgi:hypothetical protein